MTTKTLRNSLPVITLTLLLCGCGNQKDTISLKGTWDFAIDSLDIGMDEDWPSAPFTESIELPGSMRENGKGNEPTLYTRWTGSIYDSSWYFAPEMAKYRQPDSLKFPFWLTPLKYYTGPAWYRRSVEIPISWTNERITLFLERVHWESRLWIDDKEIGMQNSLVAPHEYDLTGRLEPGNHVITLRIDNRIKEVNVGPDSHSITDHTQGNWNGVIGKMELRRAPMLSIKEIQIYPDIDTKEALVRVLVLNRTGFSPECRITLDAESFNSTESDNPVRKAYEQRISEEETWVDLVYPMGNNSLLWDEFSPALYRLYVTLESNAGTDRQETEFGMREFSADGTRFTINGRPIFLRGNCDCAIFPLTGYPPMNVEDWTIIFNILKEHGLNHVRYHSWCPPEAAFRAADRAGIYLQAEGPSWANHGTAIGYGYPVDQYIYDETRLMEKYYGNHPSFVMMAYGNEPSGRNQARYLGDFVNYWKNRDNRRLYTGASVGKNWPYVPEAEYIVKSYPRGLPWEEPPQTEFDYRRFIEVQKVPYVSHEIGQYCVFPNFKEIDKYTGVVRARNFELFRDLLNEHDMGDQAEDFLYASGKLQVLCYKNEIEAALRTPGFAGFQMLQLNDFPGQGTALIGVLDAFFDPKGYTDPDEFRQFCNITVLLARIPKFVYTSSEEFRASLEISHFGPQPLENQEVFWKITDRLGDSIFTGSVMLPDIPINNTVSVSELSIPLKDVRKAEKLTLDVRLENTLYKNHWDFWVYPDTLPEIRDNQLYHCEKLDDRAVSVLNSGGVVFLQAAGHVEKGRDIVMYFKPVFWNTSWFQMRPPHTTGMLCNPDHPVFEDFPTEGYSTIQWWEILHRQQVMNLDGFPAGFRPLVQPIDTWFLSRKLGVLFEANAGKGRIMVTSIDFNTDIENRPAARQLLYSIEQYIRSDHFKPVYDVDVETIRDLMRSSREDGFKTYTSESPADLQPVGSTQ